MQQLTIDDDSNETINVLISNISKLHLPQLYNIRNHINTYTNSNRLIAHYMTLIHY